MKENEHSRENIIKPIPIRELLEQENDQPKFRFFIPSYQRGYRWGALEVGALLDDILEFSQNKKMKEERYCLQPIVVKLMSTGQYEVLDGQQRLTTLYIVLSKLRERVDDITLFEIEYETRANSAVFLQQLKGEINQENPDYYYISNAYVLTEQWLLRHRNIGNLAFKLYNEILEHLDFIWYEINDPAVDPIDVFTRINVGKIPLTNSELVKAVFLSKENLQTGRTNDPQDLSYVTALAHRQSLIAMEWDQMEKQLQNEGFWKFIYNGEDNVYDTRIDYLLDLIAKKGIHEKDHYFAFQVFYTKIKNSRLDATKISALRSNNTSLVEQEWDILKQYFDIIMEWYNHKTFNHLIGFMIYEKEDLLALLDEYKNNNRKSFLNKVITSIQTKVDIDLRSLKYSGGKEDHKIRSILVFHNIMHALIQPDTSTHFSFEKIKDEKTWSLEHIYAQNSDDIREKDQQLWSEDHLNYFLTNYPEQQKIVKSLRRLRDAKNVEREDFLKLYEQVQEFIQEQLRNKDQEDSDNDENWSWVDDEHAISNLTLLNIAANSALSNSVFAIKREKIKKLDSMSAYIPSETRKVFLKYYSKQLGNDAYWTRKDKIAYVEDIKAMIDRLAQLKK